MFNLNLRSIKEIAGNYRGLLGPLDVDLNLWAGFHKVSWSLIDVEFRLGRGTAGDGGIP